MHFGHFDDAFRFRPGYAVVESEWRGVQSLSVNGRTIKGNVVPPRMLGKGASIVAVLG